MCQTVPRASDHTCTASTYGAPLDPAVAAGRLAEEMQGGVEGSTSPKHLTLAHMARLHQLLHEARFSPPTGGHLSPAGPAAPAPQPCPSAAAPGHDPREHADRAQ